MALRREHFSSKPVSAFCCIRSPVSSVSTVMKTILALFLLGVGLAASLRAQAPVAIQYAPGSLDQLVAPIALYPDPLIALILPASTVSTDVVLAARYFEQNAAPAQVDAQPWDLSVRALAHYPDLITWMDANLAWTQALGQAFASQPDAVMQAIQEMRSRARATGSLQSTPQQQVMLTGGVIEIVPTQPSVIYVPYYDSAVVYDTGPGWGYPLVTFGMPFPVEPWLYFACDWREHRIRQGAWPRGWDNRRDGRSLAAGRFWSPPPTRRYPSSPRFDPRPGQWQHTSLLASAAAPTHPSRHTMVVPHSTRGPLPNFRGLSDQRPGARRGEVHATSPAPAPHRGPSARYSQTGIPRNFSNRGWGDRQAIIPTSHPSIQSAAPRRPAPRTERAEPPRRPTGDASRSRAPARVDS